MMNNQKKLRKDLLSIVSLKKELKNERAYSATLFNFIYDNDLLEKLLKENVADKLPN